MDEINFQYGLLLKKYVLGIAAVSWALYLVGSFFEEGLLRAGSNYILYGTKADQEAVARAAQAYQDEFDRIQNGMKEISDGIKEGAESMEKDTERMHKEFEADRKMLAERDGPIWRGPQRQDKDEKENTGDEGNNAQGKGP